MKITTKFDTERGLWIVSVGDNLFFSFEEDFWAEEFATDAMAYYNGSRLHFPVYRMYRTEAK